MTEYVYIKEQRICAELLLSNCHTRNMVVCKTVWILMKGDTSDQYHTIFKSHTRAIRERKEKFHPSEKAPTYLRSINAFAREEYMDAHKRVHISNLLYLYSVIFYIFLLNFKAW